MPSINDIITEINKKIPVITGSSINGVAISALRSEKKQPVVYGIKEGMSVAVDDKYSVILYHKLNTLNVSYKAKEGYGRGLGVIVNSYGCQMIIFLNRKRLAWTVDELFTYLQASIPNILLQQNGQTLEPYKQIIFQITSAVLNDETVWAQEYSESYRLPPEHNLFQIKYTVEAAFEKDCFINCPEETN